MNVSASQCGGSGCESGWTLYLDQSSNYSQTRCQNFGGDFSENYGGRNASFVVDDDDDDDEVDLSMVSDASSGPRHYWEGYEDDENGSFCSAGAAAAKKTSKNKKNIKEHGGNQQQHSCLDDTASSPVISFSKKKNMEKEASRDLLDYSQGCSSTHFKGNKSAFRKKFGFMKSGKAAGSKDAGGFQERNWE